MEIVNMAEIFLGVFNQSYSMGCKFNTLEKDAHKPNYAYMLYFCLLVSSIATFPLSAGNYSNLRPEFIEWQSNAQENVFIIPF